MLQTGLGSRIFDATFKHYFDRKLANLKYDQDRKLADLKHVYERGVEELRSELSQVTDRGIRSNEREYQALIASWENFIEAYYRTLSCTGRISSRPDLNSLSTDELTEYLESSLKHSSDRRYIKSAQDRNLAFGRVEQATLLNEAQTAIWEARSTLRKQSVFIPKGIDDHFERAFSILHKAWAEQHVNFSTRGKVPIDEFINLLGAGGEELRNALRDIVRSRVLRNSDNTEE